jgi:hypothetical protein
MLSLSQDLRAAVDAAQIAFGRLDANAPLKQMWGSHCWLRPPFSRRLDGRK